MKIERYGSTPEEQELLDKIKSREIVQEILKFGVSQAQIICIIKLLALELENNDMLQKIIEATNEQKKSSLLTK